MSRLRVLGVGSPQGADRLGWQVVEALQRRGLPQDVVLMACDRPGPALVEAMDGAEAVILVDAVSGDCPPGRLLHLDESGIQDAYEARYSSHAFGLAEAVALARALGCLPQRLCLMGLCVADEESPVTEADQSLLVEAVIAQLRIWQ